MRRWRKGRAPRGHGRGRQGGCVGGAGGGSGSHGGGRRLWPWVALGRHGPGWMRERTTLGRAGPAWPWMGRPEANREKGGWVEASGAETGGGEIGGFTGKTCAKGNRSFLASRKPGAAGHGATIGPSPGETGRQAWCRQRMVPGVDLCRWVLGQAGARTGGPEPRACTHTGSGAGVNFKNFCKFAKFFVRILQASVFAILASNYWQNHVFR